MQLWAQIWVPPPRGDRQRQPRWTKDGIGRTLTLQADEEEIDEVELLPELLCAVAVQVVEDAGELGGERVGKALRSIFGREGLEAMAVLARRPGDRIAKRVCE